MAVLRKISGVNEKDRCRYEEIRAAEIELDIVEIIRRGRLFFVSGM